MNDDLVFKLSKHSKIENVKLMSTNARGTVYVSLEFYNFLIFKIYKPYQFEKLFWIHFMIFQNKVLEWGRVNESKLKILLTSTKKKSCLRSHYFCCYTDFGKNKNTISKNQSYTIAVPLFIYHNIFFELYWFIYIILIFINLYFQKW